MAVFRSTLLAVLLTQKLLAVFGQAPEWATRGGSKANRGPPQESFDACASKAEGVECSFVSARDHAVNGTCKTSRKSTSAGQLHCRPLKKPKAEGSKGGQPKPKPKAEGPPQPAFDACSGLSENGACQVPRKMSGELQDGDCIRSTTGTQLGVLYCHLRPPPDATQACENLGENDTCSVETKLGEGYCRPIRVGPEQGTLSCKPKPGAEHRRNSSIASCAGKVVEESCEFRAPVMGDTESEGYISGEAGAKRNWKKRKTDFNQRRGPPQSARASRLGVCIPRELKNGETSLFCRALPPPEAIPACEELNVNDTCSYESNGTETHLELSVTTGQQPMAETSGNVLASFNINGEWTEPELFFSGSAQGETKTKVFLLPAWPRAASLTIWSTDAWCYWKILVNGTTIREDPAGPTGSDAYYTENETSTYADSPYWIEGPPSSQILDVPETVIISRRLNDPADNASSTTDTAWQQIIFSMETASSEHAGTQGSVFVAFLIHGKWTKRELVFTGASPGDTKSKDFSLAAWPQKVWVFTNSSDAYSFWKITINDVSVVEDPSGMPGTYDYDAISVLEEAPQFWIQSPPSSQKFQIPASLASTGSRAYRVEGACEQTWWDTMEGNLFCRPAKEHRKFTPQGTSRDKGTNKAEPDFGLKSDLLEVADDVKVTMVVQNVVYDTLMQDSNLKTAFVQRIESKIAEEAGEGVYAEHVTVTLAPGSVIVTAKINPPAYVSRPYLQSKLTAQSATLASGVAEAAANTPGIDAAKTGTISVEPTTIVATVSAGEASESGSTGGDSTDEKGTILIIVAAGSVVVALCMCLVSCILYRKLRASSMNPRIDGTTVAVGRPVGLGGNDIEAVDGTAVTMDSNSKSKGEV
jgi:hypothetical protein